MISSVKLIQLKPYLDNIKKTIFYSFIIILIDRCKTNSVKLASKGGKLIQQNVSSWV